MTTRTELDKTYDPAAVELAVTQQWMAGNLFHADPAAPGKPYTIVIPPPNVTGALHLGHALNNTLQDILIRKHRMDGFNALWVPGIDHAGIATQAVVEKQLKEKENKTRHDVGREALVARIWEWKKQYGDRIIMQLQRMGCSCDWDRTRFTLDEQCAAAVREFFYRLFTDGLVFRGKRLVNWDTHLQTSISDDEIYHENVKTFLWHIRYPIDGSDKQMVVATTRPETMLGDTAVAVHSEDPRWNWAIGKFVRLPLTGRLIPIIADDILVDPKFGTGVVKVTPAHDPNDYAVWQRHLNKPDAIELINMLTLDGRILDDARWSAYSGLKRDAARKKVVDDLEAAGQLEKVVPYETQVGHSDRSKTAVEPFLSDQWFVHMQPLAEAALEVVGNGTIKFYPERHAHQYLAWLGERRDWPVSRQLWWGHRIPVWSIELDLPVDIADVPVDDRGGASARLCAALDKLAGQLWSDYVDEAGEYFMTLDPLDSGRVRVNICIRTDGAPLAERLEKLGFIQDPDVLDTWFSSALWPHSTLGWPTQTAELKKYYPTSVLLTGRDIITLWVARMVMSGIYNLGEGKFLANSPEQVRDKIAANPDLIKQVIPFHTVAINPTILDGKGERMSKSKGNGVDPIDIIETHGADAMRFTLTTMATETQDVRMPVKKDAAGRNTSDKFDFGRNFCTKLWNAARFVLSGIADIKPADHADAAAGLSLADQWIISRLNQTVQLCNESLAIYRFDQYAHACYDFFWRDFCDWYVETAKPDLKDASRAPITAAVLAACLDGALRLLHPAIPFITEAIWDKLNATAPARGIAGWIDCPPSERLIRAQWPAVHALNTEADRLMPRLQEWIVAIRNLRNDHKADPKKSVPVRFLAPADLQTVIQTNKGLIELLAICQIVEIAGSIAPSTTAARVVLGECEIFIDGLVDPDADKQRAAKRIEELQKQIVAMEGRLANPSYSQKAPAHLVQQTRDQLAAAQAELAKLSS